MLEAVGNPVAVNPDRDLRREAEKREWQIRYFRRPVRLRSRLVQAVPQPSVPVAAVAAIAAAAVGAGVDPAPAAPPRTETAPHAPYGLPHLPTGCPQPAEAGWPTFPHAGRGVESMTVASAIQRREQNTHARRAAGGWPGPLGSDPEVPGQEADSA